MSCSGCPASGNPGNQMSDSLHDHSGPAGDHRPGRCPAAGKDPEQVDVDDAPEEIVAQLRDRRASADSGVADHDIEPTKPIDNVRNRPVHGIRVADIAGNAGQSPVIGRWYWIDIEGDNDGAIAVESLRDSPTNSARHAGDDDDATI